MKKLNIAVILILILLSFFSLHRSYKTSNIKNLIFLPTKSIYNAGNYVVVQGSWISQNIRENNFFRENEVNTTSIHCFIESKKCTETRGIISRLDGMSGTKNYGFYTHNFEYDIKQWTNNLIEAEHVGTGMVFDLTINLQNETAIINVSDNQNNPTASAYTDTAILGK